MPPDFDDTKVTVQAASVPTQRSRHPRSLMEASIDPLATISLDGKITDVNDAMVNVTGVPREKLVWTGFGIWFTQPELAREICPLVLSKGFVTDYPLTIPHADGHLTDVLYNASVYRALDGSM